MSLWEDLQNASNIRNEPQWMQDRRASALRLFAEQPLSNFQYGLGTGLSLDRVPNDLLARPFSDASVPLVPWCEDTMLPEGLRLEPLWEVIQSPRASAYADTLFSRLLEIDDGYIGQHLSHVHDAWVLSDASATERAARTSPQEDRPRPIILKPSLTSSSFFHLTVNLHSSAEIVIVLDGRHLSDEDASVSLSVEGTARAHAPLAVTIISLPHSTQRTHLASALSVEQDAHATVRELTLGGRFTRRWHRLTLDGSSSVGTLHTGFVGLAESQLDAHTDVIHRAGPVSQSEQISRSLLFNTAEGVEHQRASILAPATKASAVEDSQTLLLYPRATFAPVPILEIEQDDVQAQHAASVSHVRDAQLFYGRSRGLTRAQTARILMNGHLAPILHSLTTDSHSQTQVREHLDALLNDTLSSF